MSRISSENLLRSWKEISAYLDCGVRTCYRWEANLGLPIHRANGDRGKSGVFAYKNELDQWFKDTFKNGNKPVRNAGARHARLIVPLAAAAVFVALGLFYAIRGNPQAEDFRIEGSVLHILSRGKEVLGSWDTGLEDLRSDEEYRENFQVIHDSQPNMLPTLVIRDINGDGDKEVLIAPRRVDDQTGEGWLYCLDRRGKEIWKFQAGKKLICGGKEYSPDYRIVGFYCHDINGDGNLETVVEAFQTPDWPCQLTLLDAKGNRIGEFWNAGYLRDLHYYDINADGKKELIVCGIDNESHGGCLIIFDCDKIAGGSPQAGGYSCEDIRPGSELYYVTVPPSDVGLALGSVEDGLRQLEITLDGRIYARSGTDVHYIFDFGLRCLQVKWGNGFIANHEKLSRAGKITTVLGEKYRESQREQIRYYDGTTWTAKPAAVKH